MLQRLRKNSSKIKCYGHINAHSYILNRFQDILNESYKKICEENQISNDSWQVNDICVINIVPKNVFHRAKIFEKTKIEKFNVILLDKGVYEYNVEKSQIFKHFLYEIF